MVQVVTGCTTSTTAVTLTAAFVDCLKFTVHAQVRRQDPPRPNGVLRAGQPRLQTRLGPRQGLRRSHVAHASAGPGYLSLLPLSSFSARYFWLQAASLI